MPCDHKFKNYLELTKLDFEPTTLIVGTFNPAWPDTNTAEWFYGRTASNYFWDVLPRLYGESSLINATPGEWKQFCHNKQIAITDLISCIDDADATNTKHARILGGFSDDGIEYNFEDLNFVNVVQILQQRPSIRNVYFTRGITEAFWRHLWNPMMRYCNLHHLHERKLLTPSNEAQYQHDAHNELNPGDQIAKLEDYILMKWQQEWHF